jgi:hypothetical protein
MALLYRTSAAARYCTLRGRPTSAATLRKLRLKGPEDPGNHGPPFLRDPDSTHCLYEGNGLNCWVDEWVASLTSVQIPRALHLARAAEPIKDHSP